MVDLPSFFFSSCNCFCVVACEKKKNKEKNLNSCGLLYCSFISQQHTFFVFVFLDCQKKTRPTVQYRLNNKKSISKNNVEHFILHFKRLFENKERKKKKLSPPPYHCSISSSFF